MYLFFLTRYIFFFLPHWPSLQDPKRLFEGNALLRRLFRIGVLDEDHMKLDYVLGLKARCDVIYPASFICVFFFIIVHFFSPNPHDHLSDYKFNLLI